MITIEQLLESVDLDFEPRWVTKDFNGVISIFAEHPECLSSIWCSHEKLRNFGKLKLYEFENKDWKDCIYEVPRKTTGNVERFVIENDRCGNVEWWDVVNKINELVDSVNKHSDIIQQIGDWGASKGECLWCEKLTSVNLGEIKCSFL